jgi:hypothetical protein
VPSALQLKMSPYIVVTDLYNIVYTAVTSVSMYVLLRQIVVYEEGLPGEIITY